MLLHVLIQLYMVRTTDLTFMQTQTILYTYNAAGIPYVPFLTHCRNITTQTNKQNICISAHGYPPTTGKTKTSPLLIL